MTKYKASRTGLKFGDGNKERGRGRFTGDFGMSSDSVEPLAERMKDFSDGAQSLTVGDVAEVEAAPVREGQVLKLQCMSIGDKGNPVFKTARGFVVFGVGKAMVGQVVKMRVTVVKDRYAFAEIVGVLR